MNQRLERIGFAAGIGIVFAVIVWIGLSGVNSILLVVIIVFCAGAIFLDPKIKRVGPDLGLGAVPMVALAALSVLLGQFAYNHSQARYQGQLFEAVASVDVVADLCARTAGLLQTDCQGPVLVLPSNIAKHTDYVRASLSDLAIWNLLNDAGILDLRNFATPDTLAEADTIDVPTAMLVNFLRREERRGETSFGTVIELMRPCGTTPIDPEILAQKKAMEHVLALTLADLDNRTLAANNRVFENANLGTDLTAFSPILLFELPRSDLAVLDVRSDGFRGFFDIKRKAMVRPYRDEAILTALLLSGLGFGDGLPKSLIDARASEVDANLVRGYLSVFGTEASRQCPGFLNKTDIQRDGDTAIFVNTNTPDTFNIDDEAQFFRALRMREDLALYFTGRIRTADGTRSARFWLTLVTGYEQVALLMLFALGCLIAVFRSAALAWAYLNGRLWFLSNSVDPGRFIFAVRSSRWPLKLTAAILPAVGFVGTVRGIMLSLSGADQIVWASTVNERSAAISALSTDLGLAFATTLIALLLGIIISVISASEQRLADMVTLRCFGGNEEGEIA